MKSEVCFSFTVRVKSQHKLLLTKITNLPVDSQYFNKHEFIDNLKVNI